MDPLIRPQPLELQRARDFRYRAEALAEESALASEQAHFFDLASNLLVTHSPEAVLGFVRVMRLELPKDGSSLRRRAIHLCETALEELVRAGGQAPSPDEPSDEPPKPLLDLGPGPRCSG